MKLYLVRHGQALDEQEDPKRPLGQQGRAEVARVSALLETAGVQIGTVQHSGKLRAAETAAILAHGVAVDGTITHRGGMSPNDPVGPMAEQIRAMGDSNDGLMLVGHLPFMPRLAARLLCGDENRSIVQMVEGSVLCLQGTGARWEVAWLITPEVTRG